MSKPFKNMFEVLNEDVEEVKPAVQQKEKKPVAKKPTTAADSTVEAPKTERQQRPPREEGDY
jgi:hypothetical protein